MNSSRCRVYGKHVALRVRTFDVPRRSPEFDVMKLIFIVTAFVFLIGCVDQEETFDPNYELEQHLSLGFYSDLQSAFGTNSPPEGSELGVHSMVIASRNREGVDVFFDGVDVTLSGDAVQLSFDLRGLQSLSIPKSHVAACGMTCFGMEDQRVDLFLVTVNAVVTIPRTDRLLNWCWANAKPMLPGQTERQWLNGDGGLPSIDDFEDQLSSRSTYDDQVEKSCLGS